jgi:hypothetical protein
MTSKHTPGPWEQCDEFGPITHGTCAKAVNDNFLVASCTGYYGREQAQANARLIAAAPDLLEALTKLHEELLALHISGDVGRSLEDLLTIAPPNIAKATGGEQ